MKKQQIKLRRKPQFQDQIIIVKCTLSEKMFSNLLGNKLLILRLSQVYSTNDTHFAYGPCRFLRDAIELKSITLFGDGLDERDHISSDDVSSIIIKLIDKGAFGIFNVARGNSIPFVKIAELLQEILPEAITIKTSARTVPLSKRAFDVSKLNSILEDFKFEHFTTDLCRLVLGKFGKERLKKPAIFLDRDGVLNISGT